MSTESVCLLSFIPTCILGAVCFVVIIYISYHVFSHIFKNECKILLFFKVLFCISVLACVLCTISILGTVLFFSCYHKYYIANVFRLLWISFYGVILLIIIFSKTVIILASARRWIFKKRPQQTSLFRSTLAIETNFLTNIYHKRLLTCFKR